MPMGRENLRQKARRHAHVRIRNGLDVNRRPPTEDEIQDLLDGLSANAMPKFGLVKLSAMRLDDGLTPPEWFERIIRWPKGERIPLLHLAALRGHLEAMRTRHRCCSPAAASVAASSSGAARPRSSS